MSVAGAFVASEVVRELSHRLEGSYDALMNFCDVEFTLLPPDVARSYGVDFSSVRIKTCYLK